MNTAPRIGSLCTGYGGLDVATQAVFGGQLTWVADNDPGATAILTHHHPNTPNLGDITTLDWHQAEPVDILTGGYPCQPFSVAGHRKGTADARHIWPHIADAIRVLRPQLVVLENVAGHLRLGFDTVLADLARLGFDAQWSLVRASQVGAPHQRERLFVLAWPADTASTGRPGPWLRGRPAERGAAPADTDDKRSNRRPARAGQAGRTVTARHAPADAPGFGRGEGRPEPAWLEGRPDVPLGSAPDWGGYGLAIRRWEYVTGRAAPWAVDDRGRLSPLFVEWMMGLAAGWVTDVPGLTRTAQLKALGNGVVPQQAAAAIRMLHQRAFPGVADVAA